MFRKIRYQVIWCNIIDFNECIVICYNSLSFVYIMSKYIAFMPSRKIRYERKICDSKSRQARLLCSLKNTMLPLVQFIYFVKFHGSNC